jgi:hypothetical protein
MGPLAALLFAGLLAGGGGEPSIQKLAIALNGRQILVSFELADGFGAELRERIESGLPTGFVYELQLMRDRAHWWDRYLDSSRIDVDAMYNAVTHEYLVNTKHDGKLIDSRTLRDEGELRRAMTQFTAVPAFVLQESSRRERYLVRVRVELGTSQILGFIPFQTTTTWVESNKVRGVDPPL